MKIFYVDDSGNESLTTFTAIGVPAHRWSGSLGTWLAWRRHLLEEHDVDIRRRLHATDWVAGRGRPSSDEHAGLNRSKPLRWREYVHALEAISAMPEVQVLTVCRSGRDRRATYRILMRWIDELLSEVGEHGLVVVDGDNAELRTMHRELDIESRSIVEDPWKRDARDSQWPQIADFAAYAAFQHIAKVPERAFMWRWYEDCLGRCVVRDERCVDGVRGLERATVS